MNNQIDWKSIFYILGFILVVALLLFAINYKTPTNKSFYEDKNKVSETNEKIYQGPIQEGCDEKYFREFGSCKNTLR